MTNSLPPETMSSTAAQLLELLQIAHGVLNDPSKALDPILVRCKYHVDECIAVLEGAVSPDIEHNPQKSSMGSSASASAYSSSQATQTVGALLADAVSQANPSQVEQGSQVSRIPLGLNDKHVHPTSLGACRRARRLLFRQMQLLRRLLPECLEIATPPLGRIGGADQV